MALKAFTVIEIDGTEHEVTPTFMDAVAADAFMRANKRYGTVQDSPNIYVGVRCWSALRREGRVTDDFDTYSQRIGDIQIDQSEPLDTDSEIDLGGGVTGESTAPAA